jgi:hypothetical protein
VTQENLTAFVVSELPMITAISSDPKSPAYLLPSQRKFYALLLNGHEVAAVDADSVNGLAIVPASQFGKFIRVSGEIKIKLRDFSAEVRSSVFPHRENVPADVRARLDKLRRR